MLYIFSYVTVIRGIKNNKFIFLKYSKHSTLSPFKMLEKIEKSEVLREKELCVQNGIDIFTVIGLHVFCIATMIVRFHLK